MAAGDDKKECGVEEEVPGHIAVRLRTRVLLFCSFFVAVLHAANWMFAVVAGLCVCAWVRRGGWRL